ncbi:helix-turn-helix domain-containing protein [Paenibacillus sp. CC-CFT747]|nr:helix-turn-helix domain-containing protein [Paenibacillus sp. CC-CFT747]
MNKEATDKQERYTIQSIDKALDLIELLADRGSLNLLELAELLDQPKSSTYRIVLTLENRGYISRSDEDGKYCLGYKQLMLTRNLLERNNLRSAAWNEMKKLSDLYGDTINLGVLMEGEVLYVEIIESTQPLRMTDTVGSRAPFNATAIGKAITAYLPQETVEKLIRERGLPALTEHTIVTKDRLMQELEQVRIQGYSIDDQEMVEGARCLAAPIFNMYGSIQGAVSMSGAMHRFPTHRLSDMARQIRLTADGISRKLGHPPFPLRGWTTRFNTTRRRRGMSAAETRSFLSPLTLGTVQLGLTYGVANQTRQPDQETATRLLDAAVEGGIHSFDTAPSYGSSEEVLGRYFAGKTVPSLISKWTLSEEPGKPALRQQIYDTLENSAAKLGLIRVPAMLLHTPLILASRGPR